MAHRRKYAVAGAVVGLAATAGLFFPGTAAADTLRGCPPGPYAQFIIQAGPSGQQSAINMRTPTVIGSNCRYTVDYVEFAGPGGIFRENVSSVELNQNTHYPLSGF
jgi:hypothetical protein